MNLQEILLRKKQSSPLPPTTCSKDSSINSIQTEEKEIINYDSPALTNRHIFDSYEERSSEQALLTFLILYNKAASKDVFVGNGDGARLLYYFLDCPKVLSESYPPTPLGLSIRDSYILNNLLHIPQNAAYHILKNAAEGRYTSDSLPSFT